MQLRVILNKIRHYTTRRFEHASSGDNFAMIHLLDRLAVVPLLRPQRSNLERVCKSILIVYLVAQLATQIYDIVRQEDIRMALDVFSMNSIFIYTFCRILYLRWHAQDLHEFLQFDRRSRFRADVPSARQIRKRVKTTNLKVMLAILTFHHVVLMGFVWQCVTKSDYFIYLLTYSPVDWSQSYPLLDRVVRCVYSSCAFAWAYMYNSGSMVIITIVRLLITEFRVLIDSLKTLDQQIHAQQHAKSGAGTNDARTALKELLREHIERHQELIRTMHRLRSLLRFTSLLHIGFYLVVEAAFLVRLLIVKGEFALGLMIPVSAISMFIFEMFVFCMHIETLLDLNKQVGFVLYSFRWYDHMLLGKSYRQNISIVLFQAHNTIPFTAGGGSVINAQLFANLVQITYSVVMGLGYMLAK